MATYAVHAAHFVLPGRLTGEGYLTITEGRFGAFSTERPDCEIVDHAGAYVGAGLVDTHIHGFHNHATTDIDPAGINDASVALAQRGTTAWLPTTFTDSAENIGNQCEAIADALDERDEGFPGARIPGIYLEGPFFTEKHKGAQNPKYLVPPSYDVFAEWQRRARGLIRKSALAPEYPEAPEYISRLAAEGVVTALGHTDATYDESVAAVDAGATVFVHTYNGMRGLHQREPGVLGCAMTTDETYAELICDGHHVQPGACAALVRAKGWEHVVLITDCLACGGMPEGNYMSGGLPVVMKDDLCYLRNEDGTTGSIAGSVLTLAKGVKNMVDWGIVAPEQAIRMGSEVAARSAGVDDVCGSMLPGRHADFNVYAADMTLAATYVGGKLVARA
ncbi:N-acetylglucosamine-6-phosphate deacetylase [Tractidigestivibacter sp.]|uniref:N-acetylglucosamine-6-phosphate deacetylase n=1 Tax=Tractidigestivibacter sp. TaxID=2847320 RepID=UPI002A90ECE0|nr:N-acetylglucosamine-6-phosphate deacetylase [Tractidigestivibacter sp.]MDY5270587.1 N-acetylglucosamine-6-phosphate deacetylase [Tractidigestivibacter sp.]